MNTDLQASTIEINVTNGWYHLVPMGKIIPHDGRAPLYLKDPEAVIARSVRPKVDLHVDWEHSTLFSAPGTKNPAAGWIKDLVTKEDGIWAKIDWTARGQNSIDSKDFRYLSPVYSYDTESGEILSIKHASLTTHPNFELVAAASAQNKPTTFLTKTETFEMEEFLNKLAEILGLEDATEETVLAAVAARLAAVAAEKEKEDEGVDTDGASSAFGQLRTTLGLKADANANEVVAAASAIVQKANTAVPADAVAKLTKEMNELKSTIATGAASAKVSEAMRQGKIPPAMKEWALGYASSDPKGFENYVAKVPAVAGAAAQIDGEPEKVEPEDIVLTDEQKEVLEALGVDEEKAKEALAEEENQD